MINDVKLAKAVEDGGFIITAEFLAGPVAAASGIKDIAAIMKGLTAVNVSDNPFGPAMSGIAASAALLELGIEPVYQLVTRDRNRIALQSDLLGASSLGIKNVLCLSGYHQTLTNNPESANVYDIDSTQLIALVKKMNAGELLDGTRIKGSFLMLIGAAANPYLKPLELNLLRIIKKADAGAAFFQTNPVFDADEFSQWFEACRKEGIADKAAILAGILPLAGADEAEEMRNKYTEINIPDEVIKRLKSAGDKNGQAKEGLTICAEIIGRLKSIKGLRGIHIHSGGKEAVVAELLAKAGLK